MKRVTVREARDHLAELLSSAEAGQSVEITRRGQAVAKLVPIKKNKYVPLPDLTEFRSRQNITGEPMSKLVIRERRKARY